LPWRDTRDPNRIWVSEVMLQQTRVAAALPFYQTFVSRFPTIASLARAREAEVLLVWAGLGYYRRARHLHAAARHIVQDHGGRVPEDPAVFGKLPGVGRYTTGAVLSLAFDRPMAALDGNVARVLARLFAVSASVRAARGARRLWTLAETLVPARRPGAWNQALMELGATICLPRAPRCGICPLARWCRARSLGRVDAFPPAVSRPAVRTVRRAIVVIARAARVLMVRREGPQLTGLWEPPGVELEDRAESSRGRIRAARVGRRARAALGLALGRLGVRARLTPTPHLVRHVITTRRIEVELWRGVTIGPVPRRARLRWVDRDRPATALTALARKVLALKA